MNEETKNIKTTKIEIVDEMEKSFIDYAMSVIVSRAIPDARDGLKPVHRRILYAMNSLEMTHRRPFKKSARVVGEVIAKYHPHGDTAVYESMVRLAQPFSMRYPLVWGQGNFGSIDGDNAAAMRYTEVRLKPISSLMLDEIKQRTVDFRENYDGSEREPVILPSKIPNLLMNGSTGIAVGMATSIPPHNIVEVLNASKELAKNPEYSIDEILEHVSAPDFPTGGEIVNPFEVREGYKTGRGRAVVRGKAKIEMNEKNSKGKIIINEIPYMVNKTKLIEKIVQLHREKIITSISDIRDESNRKGIRIVIELKSGFIPEVELNKLYKHSQLQTTFPINLLALVNNRPKTLNIKEILQIYIDHQIEILTRKSKYKLERYKNRRHILEGLKVALENINEIIELIKKADSPKTAQEQLIAIYKLTETQAKSILEMKLQRLTGLEQKNLLEEINNLDGVIKELEVILVSHDARIENILNLIDELIEKYGDERRTEIAASSSWNISNEDLIPREEVIITITKNGYIKRIKLEDYRLQKRGGTGSKSITTYDDDFVNKLLLTNTHDNLLFFSSKGKVYKLKGYMIPQFSKQAKGIPIVNLIQIEEDEQIKEIIQLDSYDDTDLVFVTKKGKTKRVYSQRFESIFKNGKKAITLPADDEIVAVFKILKDEDGDLLLGNKNGKVVRFSANSIRTMGRTAYGVRGMQIDDGEIIDATYSQGDGLIFALSNKGFGKLTHIDRYRKTNRGTKGVKTINVAKAGELIALKIVDKTEQLMVISNRGTIIRTSFAQIRETGRNAKGVTVAKLRSGEIISNAIVIKSDSEIEAEIIEKTTEVRLDLED